VHGECSIVLRLLDFLTGEVHPLATNPVLTIVTHVTFDHRHSLDAQAEVLGDIILVHVYQRYQSHHDNQLCRWYLVEWKTGRAVSVSVQDCRKYSRS
jgi:hypothetical protein